MFLARTHTYPSHISFAPRPTRQSNNSGPAAADASACLRPFLANARAKGFPVLFAETTPRYVGAVAADGAWDRWFGPFMAIIKEFDDVVKGFCYIDWQWSRFPQWSDWKDARVEVPGAVGAQFRAALGATDGYVHAMPRDATLRALELA